jgi:hypothetical protein
MSGKEQEHGVTDITAMRDGYHGNPRRISRVLD